MKKYLNIENIAYTVVSVGENKEVEVNGIVVFNNEYEDSIEFVLGYKSEYIEHYEILDSEFIDFKNLGVNLSDLEDYVFDNLPIEDIERKVEYTIKERNSEDREYYENLKHNDINEYICVVKNNYGGYDYE